MEREARHEKIREEREKKKIKKPNKPDFKKKEYKENIVKKKEIAAINLNKADTAGLLQIPEIGPFFAKNIINYRERLGGFIDKEQLLEVYGFDSSRLAIITPHINIYDNLELRKINVNNDDFKTILRHPYIEYEDVKKIVNYRESKGFIKDWETYLKVVDRDSINLRLRLYLEF